MTEPRRLRVLHVLDTLGMGGAETWLMALLRLWSRTGAVQMDFLLTSGNSGLFDVEARRLGANLHYVEFSRSNLASFARRFRQVLRDGRYDAIHDHQDYASGWHFLIGYGVLPRIRITHVHNPWLHMEANYAIGWRRKWAAIAGERLVKTIATHVCGTSREALIQYDFNVGRCGPNISVVHCGIAIDEFSANDASERLAVRQEFQWEADTKIILFVGRLDRALEFDHPKNHKNSWLAVNIARAAWANDTNIRLLMAGSGDEQRREIERCIARWGLEEKLRLIGVRRDIGRLMRAADILLFPSSQEGLGMVAVEAQAAGLPVLASTAVPRECIVIPALYETISLSASLEEWASTLLQVLSTPRPSVEACRRAFQDSDFAIENSARRLIDIYDSEHF